MAKSATGINNYQDYLELLRIVIGGSISAVVPLTNYAMNYLPVTPDRANLFATFSVLSAAFVVPLVYSSREFLWEWHSDILGLKGKLFEVDEQLATTASTGPTEALFTDRKNLTASMRKKYYSGGEVRLQLLALMLFLVAMAGYGSYLWTLASQSLFLYSASSGSLSGAFALVALVIFGRPNRTYMFRDVLAKS